MTQVTVTVDDTHLRSMSTVARSLEAKGMQVDRVMEAMGFITGSIALVYHHDRGTQLALVVTLALIINHCLATVSGAAIPFIMKSMCFDPAQSATIFATTVTDVGGFFSLLGLAALLLH